MSAPVINLRRARKTMARVEREGEAAANRARHGRTKSERAAETLETRRAERLLDGALRETPSSPTDGG